VSPEDLRAEAAWLLNLSGSRCAWPIETLRDLRDYAESVANDDDDLTGAEVRGVEEVVARLDEALATPEERRAELRRKKLEKDLEKEMDALIMRRAQGKILPARGTAARKQQSKEKQAKVIRKWNSLSSLPERERAGSMAQGVDLSPRHVRRVLRDAGIK
jgi:hypothetical protein